MVQRACQQFLAGAGLALDEHGGIGRCHELELREHQRERGAAPDDPVEAALGDDDLTEDWSFPTRFVSSVADLVPVEFLRTRSHNVTPWSAKPRLTDAHEPLHRSAGGIACPAPRRACSRSGVCPKAAG